MKEKKPRKVLHLHIKNTNEHKYYGSLVALCKDNEQTIIPKEKYHTLKRLQFNEPYTTDTYTIFQGELKTPSDIYN